jgi:hypothetical protein
VRLHFVRWSLNRFFALRTLSLAFCCCRSAADVELLLLLLLLLDPSSSVELELWLEPLLSYGL